MRIIVALFFIYFLQFTLAEELLFFAIGNENHDASRRLSNNAFENGIKFSVINYESSIKQISSKPNKLEIIRDQLNHLKENNDIVLFTETSSYLLKSKDEIIKVFKQFNSDILLSSTNLCKPDSNISEKFPTVNKNETRFIGNDGIIGYAKSLKTLFSVDKFKPVDDYQYYLSKVYTDSQLRDNLKIKLDTKSELFLNLENEIENAIIINNDLINNKTNNKPLILLSGNTQNGTIHLNSLLNHLKPINIEINNQLTYYPFIYLSIFIDEPTPFIEEYFNKIISINYDKSKIYLYISNLIPNYEVVIKKFLEQQNKNYLKITYINSKPINQLNSIERRQKAELEMWEQCVDCEFMLYIDSSVHIIDNNLISKLINFNQTIITPSLSKRNSYWSNWWGMLNDDGYYQRSWDYLDILNEKYVGLYNVPHIMNFALIKRRAFENGSIFDIDNNDYDMALSNGLKRRGLFMHVTNQLGYVGYIVDNSKTAIEHLHNDLWEIFTNPLDWEEKYINENYTKYSNEKFTKDMFEQPCTDVFWWPLLSEKFAKEFIEEMEYFGQWSEGKNNDTRLEGGYEAVPTRDIHARQIDWEEHWHEVMKKYVYPIQIKLFEGYSDVPRARMNFVVRYKPTEQDRLRPHQDASSYTLNIALNRPDVDYVGGGARFTRYNCTVDKSRVGWTLMHPGRVTHHHEGLPTTAGTRYIFVTFVNP